MAVEEIWGIGPATASRLHGIGIRTVGDLADYDERTLVSHFGNHGGRRLHALARFRNPEPVRGNRRRRSFGSQSALRRRHHPPAELDSLLIRIVERVSRRMREAQRAGRTVVLRLRFADFTYASRSHTLPRPVSAPDAILVAAHSLLVDARPDIERRGITLLGVALTNLDDEGAGLQLELTPERVRSDALDRALDQVHRRFGRGTVTRGPRPEEDRLL